MSHRSIAHGFILGLAFIDLAAPAFAATANSPDSSRILELYESEAESATNSAKGAPARIDLTGYRRADMIGYIYEGKFELVPATGLDNIRYYTQTVADLAAQCPDLKLEAAKAQLVPYMLAGVADLVDRFQKGTLSQSEVLQAAWMAMLGLNQRRSCTYTPGVSGSRDQAQARCTRAGQERGDLGVLPSLDAAQDLTLFLGRHGCNSAPSQHLARQIIAFGRQAHARTHLTERMPSPNTAEGRAYSSIFENCARSAIDTREHAWCGCYARTLHSLKPPDRVLQALARNPFVDGSSYMSWVVQNIPGGEALFSCESVYRGKLDWRESYAPRPTACLVKPAPVAGKSQQCEYRSAWGRFTLTSDRCTPEISSRRWGYREVDCATGGAIATLPTGPREWKQGIFTMVDYEHEVAPDFAPPLPPDAREKHPLQVRLLKRDTPGLLKSMTLTVMTYADMTMLGVPMHLLETTGPDIAAIDREGGLLLSCSYRTKRGLRSEHLYWYEKVPQHINRSSSGVVTYLQRIKGPATVCPAREPI